MAGDGGAGLRMEADMRAEEGSGGEPRWKGWKRIDDRNEETESNEVEGGLESRRVGG